MKKLALVCFTLFGVLSLSACSGERSYNYEKYKAMLAKKEFAPKETKVHIEIEEDGVKSTSDLTYDFDYERWTGTVIENFDGEDVEMTTYEALNIVPYVSTLSYTAEYFNSEVNKAYKFYASKDEYRIVMNITNQKGSNEGEVKFNKDGLLTYSYGIVKNKDGETVHEETKVYTYSL